eukprot:TRINITY_DN52123_c0_g1_i1.p1 TRINITY_DN52123_c0_g1~~TRINITY_DN52123_c0_g1_i1.p1  ORF type:complete len:364 (-),score=64.74 TRINITY_DN52123_c0_g1_i1:52-1041(-)
MEISSHNLDRFRRNFINGFRPEKNIRCVLWFVTMVSFARAHYEENKDSCSFTLRPGTAMDDGLLSNVDGLLGRVFAFSREFEALSAEEERQFDNVAKIKLDVPQADQALVNSSKTACKPSTYLAMPVDDILAHQGFALGRTSRLCDLGAGMGRPLLRAALKYPGLHAVGVELSDTRWRSGCNALRQLSMILHRPVSRPRNRLLGKVELRRGDLMQADVADATHIFVFGTCFPTEMMVALQWKLLRELPHDARVFCAGDRGLWRSRLETEESVDAGSFSPAGQRRFRGFDACTESEDGRACVHDDIARRLWRLELVQLSQSTGTGNHSEL